MLVVVAVVVAVVVVVVVVGDTNSIGSRMMRFVSRQVMLT